MRKFFRMITGHLSNVDCFMLLILSTMSVEFHNNKIFSNFIIQIAVGIVNTSLGYSILLELRRRKFMKQILINLSFVFFC